MPFDLATAKPVGGFDLSTAKPVATLDASEYDPSSPAYQAKYGATSGMSLMDKLKAGAGKALFDLGRGAAQTVGLESRQDVARSRALDAPLMATTPGKIGNIAGNIAATIPALAIPGAASIPGAAAVGAGLGFLQPSTSTKETVLNTGIGGAAGAAGQWLGNKVAGAVQGRLDARAAQAADEASLNSVRDAVLRDSRAAGYVIPPTAVNPSALNTGLESVAGKAATRQGAEAINAGVTNKLIKDDLGIAANQPITQQALSAIRDKAGQVYGLVRKTGPIVADQTYLDAIAKLGTSGADLEGAFPGIGAQASEKVKDLVTSLAQPQFDSNQAVAAFRFLNERAKEGFKAAFAKGGDQQLLELARAQRGAADAMGELIERHLSAAGKVPVAQAWQDARTLIAKSYTAEAALKGGNVNALKLAAQLRKGAPLSGGFKTAAQFADTFGEVARLPKSGVGVSKLAASLSAAGAGEALLHGHPLIAAGIGAAAAAPYGVRAGLLSSVGQRALATPSYAPGMLGTAGLQAIGAAGRYGTLPAYLAASQLAQAQQQDPAEAR